MSRRQSSKGFTFATTYASAVLVSRPSRYINYVIV
jgi:hypothetical protein